MSAPARAAAFFDLDKTVIAKSSTLAFGKPFYRGGLVNRRAVLKSSFAQFVYLLQGADEDSMDRMRDYLKVLCAGWPVETVNAIVAETLHELIDPMVYAEAVALFDEHRAAGVDPPGEHDDEHGIDEVGLLVEIVGIGHSRAACSTARAAASSTWDLNASCSDTSRPPPRAPAR